MQEVSTLRLYALRGSYLLIALAMGLQIWPLILRHSTDVEHMKGVVRSMLGALTLLCALFGARYPLKMLPLLFFEFAWKAIWVLSFGLPLWWAGRLDVDTAESLRACLLGVVLVPLVMPWGYVRRHYLAAAGDPWRAPVPRAGAVRDAAV
ncbi:MAG TPA: hypothetical protein VFJ82_23405 [Longimicrobium sp.]|nr:hypothetical protein [Longimicrobium sp.]